MTAQQDLFPDLPETRAETGAGADVARPAWRPDRAAGLARLAAFQPRMGRYGGVRNHDLGPQDRSNVSALSPWIRRRLVTEAETVAAALDRFAPSTVDKFVQEVVWRSYFKGWLEHRPSVWTAYRADLARLGEAVAKDGALRARLAEAEAGETGLAPFDAWARELEATGWLHNHARMWFASIWIFTLGLPWQLGADLFLRRLLDGDPASNTCSWRWVAGLHTPGRNYVARASNITKYTDGRFGAVHGLAKEPVPLDEGGLPPRGALRMPDAPRLDRPTALLITEDDGRLEEALPMDRMVAAATLRLSDHRSAAGASEAVVAFDAGGLADAAARAEAAGAPPAHVFAHPEPAEIVAWAVAAGAEAVAAPFCPVGWTGDFADRLRPALAAEGIALQEVRRDWDAAFHPHATAGFFKVKKAIPRELRALGFAV